MAWVQTTPPPPPSSSSVIHWEEKGVGTQAKQPMDIKNTLLVPSSGKFEFPSTRLLLMSEPYNTTHTIHDHTSLV